MMNIRTRATQASAVLGVALLALTGCAAGDGAPAGASQEAPVSKGSQASAVSIEDAWVKTAEHGDMTAGFGTLVNSSDEDVTVVSVASSASPMMELHETVADRSGSMMMREVEGGFVIPANGDLLLEPGSNHLMMLDLPEAINAGDDVKFTLTFADDSTYDFTAVVKDYAGANENYSDGDDSEMDMDHGDMNHEAMARGEN